MTRSAPEFVNFPVRTLGAGTALHRIHRAANERREGIQAPNWLHFSTDGSGRFDVAPEGTWYGAESTLGALLETARGLTLLSPEWLGVRRVTTIVLTGDLRLADATAPSAYARGVTNAIACGADYSTAQELARDLADAGFDGIRYLARHDVAAAERSMALFGTGIVRRVLTASTATTQSIQGGTVDAGRPYGIRAVDELPPTAGDDWNDYRSFA